MVKSDTRVVDESADAALVLTDPGCYHRHTGTQSLLHGAIAAVRDQDRDLRDFSTLRLPSDLIGEVYTSGSARSKGMNFATLAFSGIWILR